MASNRFSRFAAPLLCFGTLALVTHIPEKHFIQWGSKEKAKNWNCLMNYSRILFLTAVCYQDYLSFKHRVLNKKTTDYYGHHKSITTLKS